MRLTFHAPDLNAGSDDATALAVLRDFAKLKLFDWVDTAEHSERRLQVSLSSNPSVLDGEEHGAARVSDRNGHELAQAIFWPEAWRHAQQEIANQSTYDPNRIWDDVLIAAGHEAWKHDLLVTTASALLAGRLLPPLRESNICRPVDAAKIIGLFLRFRNHWGFAPNFTLDANTFYSLLLRATTEPLHKQHGVTAGTSDPEIAATAYSISARCRRALEARDAIGVQFYRHASWRTAEIMLYHFDYLTLLLSGAFDAIARVARHVLALPKRRLQVNFRQSDFLADIAAKAPLLHAAAVSPDMRALSELLSCLRNKIHDAKLGELMYSAPPAPTIIVAKLHSGDWTPISNAAHILGGLDAWGLVSLPGGGFEPYTYASRLVRESFVQLASVSDALKATVGASAPPSVSLSPEIRAYVQFLV